MKNSSIDSINHPENNFLLLFIFLLTGCYSNFTLPTTPTVTSTSSPSSTMTSTLTITPTITPMETNTASFTLTPTPLTVKPVDGVSSFSVVDKYDPSGFMGDIGDVTVAKQGETILFTYKIQGRGDHEWDFKYKSCALNLDPARFGGVILLDPPNNFGTEEGGYDLRGFKTIAWEARSLNGDTWVEFLIGGVRWQWMLDKGTNCWIKAAVPHPDSMSRIPLGSKLLTEKSQSFQYDLSTLPEEYFRDVLGGFGWTISWGPNDVELDTMATTPGPIQSKTIVIEVSNIRYEK
jgi:hypothetical protein